MEDKKISCDKCEHCIYIEEGDMYCDLFLDHKNKTFKLVYDEFKPGKDYRWCNGKRFKTE